MKSKSSLRSFLALAGSSLLAISSASASTLYWDGATPAGDPTGGTGTWDTSTQNWDTALTGGSASAWTSGDYAIFGTPAGTVTVGSGINTSGIDFTVTGYVLDATSNGLGFSSGANQIRLSQGASNSSATINGAISGTGSMNIQSTSTGTLGFNSPPTINFGGTSTGGWTGATTITRGIAVNLENDNQALNSTSGITLNGGMIRLTNTDATSITNNRIKDNAAITINGGGGIQIANTAGAGRVYSENIGNVTFNSGYSKFVFTTSQNGGSGNAQTLTLNSLTRNGHSVVSLVAASATSVIQVTGATQTAAGEIIGPWAISGNGNTDDDYAVYNSSGQIAYLNAANSNDQTTWSTGWSTTVNTKTTLAFDLTADRTFNTLRLALGNDTTSSVGDSKLATYGLLISAGVRTTINAGASGFVTIPTDNGSGELYLINGNASDVRFNAPIRDNGSAKLTLVLGGGNGQSFNLNGDSNYTGGTVIARSTVRNSATSGMAALNIGHANAFGASTNYLKFDSGFLDLKTFNVTVGEFSGEASSYITASAGGTLTVGTGTTSASSTEFKGLITNGQIVKNGDGRLTLSGINTANATTAQYTVNGGTLQFAKVASFYGNAYNAANTANWTKAKTIVNSGGALAFNVGGTEEFTATDINLIMTNLGGSNAAGTEGFQAGSRLGLDTTNAVGGSFTQGNAIADSSGAGGGAIGLTKLGTGALVLDKANTYTGGTTVSAGKLLVNNTTGSGTGTNTVTVASGATLGGSGAISGAVNVSGQLSAGNSIETLATGTLSMANTSTLVHELDSSVADSVASDLLKVTGDLNFTGTVNLTLADLALTDVAFAVNDKFSLINYTGAWNGGFLTFGVNELIDEEVFTFGLNTWRISYDDAEGGLNYTGEYAGGADSFVNITAMTVVPEPAAALLGSLGLLTLLRRRRQG